MSELNSLFWEYTYEIVLALMAAHPDAAIEEIGLEQLYQWIIALPGFADDPALVNERILKDILTEWYEAQDG